MFCTYCYSQQPNNKKMATLKAQFETIFTRNHDTNEL